MNKPTRPRCLPPFGMGLMWEHSKYPSTQPKPKLKQIINHLNILNTILAQKFADFFENKVKTIIQRVEISNDVYNGKQKMFSQNAMFMTTQNIIKCFDSIQNKNSEGFDRIPQRILVDGLEHLLDPLTKLFKLIYNFKQIPHQWLVSKITPIHKKVQNKISR